MTNCQITAFRGIMQYLLENSTILAKTDNKSKILVSNFHSYSLTGRFSVRKLSEYSSNVRNHLQKNFKEKWSA